MVADHDQPAIGATGQNAIAVFFPPRDGRRPQTLIRHAPNYTGDGALLSSLTLRMCVQPNGSRHCIKLNTNGAHGSGEPNEPAGAPRLLSLFDAAVAAAHPDVCLPAHLPASAERRPAHRRRRRQGGRCHGGGCRASLSRAGRARPRHRASRPHRTAPPRPCAASSRACIGIVAARHPTPDAGGVRGSRADARAGTHGDRATIWCSCCLSGGASSLWAAPAAGLDLAAKTALTRGLLKSGADIYEMNTVRRHISRIKGGRLQEGDAGAHADACHLRCAGRRPRNHRFGADRSRSDHAGGRARRARPPRRRACGRWVSTMPAAVDADLGRSGQRDAQARRSRLRQRRVPHHRHAGRRACRRGRAWPGAPATRWSTSATP